MEKLVGGDIISKMPSSVIKIGANLLHDIDFAKGICFS